MTEVQREIRHKKRVIEYAEKIGHVGRACRHFGSHGEATVAVLGSA